MNEPELIRSMLDSPAKENPRTIAVIGLSEVPSKPSHYVSKYMQQHGYKIYPVNPSIAQVLGEKAYPSLSDLPVKPDIVNVFRLPKFIPAIVDEMIQLKLPNIWVQMGIINQEGSCSTSRSRWHPRRHGPLHHGRAPKPDIPVTRQYVATHTIEDGR